MLRLLYYLKILVLSIILIVILFRDIIGLNEIATDLNVMVGEQGEQIDDIGE